jgi:hypothetical protein
MRSKKQKSFTAYFAIMICNTVESPVKMNQAGVVTLRLLLCIRLKIKSNLLEQELSSVNINFNSSNDQITLKPSVIFSLSKSGC